MKLKALAESRAYLYHIYIIFLKMIVGIIGVSKQDDIDWVKIEKLNQMTVISIQCQGTVGLDIGLSLTSGLDFMQRDLA